MRQPAALAAALVLATPAVAAERPPAMPAVDATIVYQVRPQHHDEQRVRTYFGRHGDLLRVDSPNGAGETVLDRNSGDLTVVMNDQHAFMVIPSNGPVQDPFMLDPKANFQSAGTTQIIAGLTCNDWRVSSPKGHANVCITADGLLLQASGVDGAGASGEIRAVDISVNPLPPSVFAPPPSFTRIAHPAARQ